MKKPSLRFRQVFEHGTHFKVTRPMGNPITIAKSAISPTMQARLRKFAQGGEIRNYQVGGGVAAPADDLPLRDGYETPAQEELIDVAPAGLPPLLVPLGPSGVAAPKPAAAPAPVADVAPVSGSVAVEPRRYRPFESEAPRRVRPFEAPESVALRSTAGVGEPAAAEAAAEPAAAEPVAAKPVATEPAAELTEQQKLAAQLRGETQAAIQAEQQRIAKVQEAEIAAADLAADQAKAYQAEVERYQQQVADARKIQKEASDDMAAGRNVGSYFSRLGTWNQIGTALSLAAGAFATGLTGVPNFALQIYNNAIEKDLEKQRDDRNSLWTKFVNAGNTAQEADQLVRASMDKALAARAAQQAAITRNAKAADGFAKFSAELNQKSETAIARIEQSKAVAAKARAEAVVAEAKPAQEAIKQLRDEVKRMEDLERQKKLDALAQQELNIKRRQLAIAERKEKREAAAEQPPTPGASEYDQLMGAFRVEGAKGAAKRLAQTIKVDGVSLLTTDPQTKQDQQKYWNGVSQSLGTLDKLIKKIEALPAGVALLPAQKAEIDALAGQFAVAYPKLEGFRRALSVADKDVVLSKIIKDPGSITSGVLGTSLASLRTLKKAADADKYDQLKNVVVEGDPNLAKFAGAEEIPLTRSTGAAR